MTPDVFVLGPVAMDSYLDVLALSILAKTQVIDGVVTVGASVGGSGDASIGAFNAGSPIIQRGLNRIGEHSAIRFAFGTGGGQLHLRVPIGVRVHSGARYVLVAVSIDDVNLDHRVIMSLFVSRIVRDKEAEAGSADVSV